MKAPELIRDGKTSQVEIATQWNPLFYLRIILFHGRKANAVSFVVNPGKLSVTNFIDCGRQNSVRLDGFGNVVQVIGICLAGSFPKWGIGMLWRIFQEQAQPLSHQFFLTAVEEGEGTLFVVVFIKKTV